MKFLVTLLALAVAGTMAVPVQKTEEPTKLEKVEAVKVTEQTPEKVERQEKAFKWNQSQTGARSGFYNPAPVKTQFVPVAQVAQVAPVVRREPVKNYEESEVIPIVRSTSDLGIENFNYGYETGNGIAVEAVGELRRFDDKTAAVVMRGSYQYIGEDGRPILVTYVADETGFHAESDAIPVAPEVPEAIARSLEYIKAHPYQETEEYKKYNYGAVKA